MLDTGCRIQDVGYRIQEALTYNEGTKKKPLTHAEVEKIAKKMMVYLDGLNKPAIELVLECIKGAMEDNYFLSITKSLN